MLAITIIITACMITSDDKVNRRDSLYIIKLDQFTGQDLWLFQAIFLMCISCNWGTVHCKTWTVEKSDEFWWIKHFRKFDEQNFDELS